MKRVISVALSLLICFTLAACGGGAQSTPPEEEKEKITQDITENTAAKAEQAVPEVQEMVTFFEGIRPVSVTSDEKYYYARYITGLGGMELVHQYVDVLTDGQYPFSLLDKRTADKDDGAYEYYYFCYEGDDRIKPVWEGEEWHIAVEADVDKRDEDIYISVKYSPDIYLKDDGHRADWSKTVLPVLTPTPKPAPSPTPEPTQKSEQRTTTAPESKPMTPVMSVDKNTSYIPEFSAFLGRNPSEEKDRYYGGTRKYYQKLPLDTQGAVVSEVLSLLDSDRYQLELIEKVDANNRIEYNYRYTGNVGMDLIHSKNDDTRYYNLQFTVYNKNNDNGHYGIHFHYSPQFVEENVGYTVSAGLSGGSGGGGGTVDFEGNDIPEFSKLECLTCHGTKDCPSCSGRGYKVVDDINKDCTRCNRGKCPACGGTGTRN